jgi:hypothetical protein
MAVGWSTRVYAWEADY